MLTDLHPPPVEPITLAEAKSFLRLDHDEENDFIETLIQSARERLEDRLGLALIERAMRLDHSEGGDITLPRWPISSIDSVQVDGQDTSVFTVNLHARPVTVTTPLGQSVSLSFTSGYGTTPSDVPAPLRQAMLLLVAKGYEHRHDDQERLPLMVDALTMPYRVVGL